MYKSVSDWGDCVLGFFGYLGDLKLIIRSFMGFGLDDECGATVR